MARKTRTVAKTGIINIDATIPVFLDGAGNTIFTQLGSTSLSIDSAVTGANAAPDGAPALPFTIFDEEGYDQATRSEAFPDETRPFRLAYLPEVVGPIGNPRLLLHTDVVGVIGSGVLSIPFAYHAYNASAGFQTSGAITDTLTFQVLSNVLEITYSVFEPRDIRWVADELTT